MVPVGDGRETDPCVCQGGCALASGRLLGDAAARLRGGFPAAWLLTAPRAARLGGTAAPQGSETCSATRRSGRVGGRNRGVAFDVAEAARREALCGSPSVAKCPRNADLAARTGLGSEGKCARPSRRSTSIHQT